MEWEEIKSLVNTAIESDDPKQVQQIIDKIAAQEEQTPGAIEAIYSGISDKMHELLQNGHQE
ncbi:MAG: hypothetical protein ACO3E1_08395 [Flavobacteriales bacterium]